MDTGSTFDKRLIMPPAIALILLLALWEGCTRLFEVNPIILPAPTQVAYALWEQKQFFAWHGMVTLLEALTGFVLGAILAISLASLSVMVPWMGRVIMPFAIAIKATPIIVLAPLIILWISGFWSKTLIACIASLFPILVSANSGLRAIDQESLDLFKLHGASEFQIYKYLRFPHALPEIFSGLRIASTVSIVGAVVGEFTGASAGLGHMIIQSSYYLRTDKVIAGAFLLSVMGIIFFNSISWLHRKLIFWDRDL